MIYLIGAPPRCGKTTLAKMMSKKTKIPWISCDTLEAISKAYVPRKKWRKKYPYSFLRHKKGARDNDVFYSTYPPIKIISVLKEQAKIVHNAIEATIACEIDNGNDYIIEGYHIVPDFAHRMIKKYGAKNMRVVFLIKFDANKFAKDVQKSTTPNDWLIELTKKQETFIKVGKMVSLFSNYFEKEARKFNLRIFITDANFKDQINKATKYLLNA